MGKVDRVNDSTGEPYWKRRDPEQYRVVRRRHELKKKYGLTLEQYDQILESQCYLCATCGIILRSDVIKNICVDHDHKTEAIRGILCGRCNKALGLIHDDIETLKQMIEYLERKECLKTLLEKP